MREREKKEEREKRKRERENIPSCNRISDLPRPPAMGLDHCRSSNRVVIDQSTDLMFD